MAFSLLVFLVSVLSCIVMRVILQDLTVLPSLPVAVVDYAVEASNLAHRILVLREILETGAGNSGRGQTATPSRK